MKRRKGTNITEVVEVFDRGKERAEGGGGEGEKWKRRSGRGGGGGGGGEEARAQSVRRRPGGNFGSTTPAMPASGASPWPGKSFWDPSNVLTPPIKCAPKKRRIFHQIWTVGHRLAPPRLGGSQ